VVAARVCHDALAVLAHGVASIAANAAGLGAALVGRALSWPRGSAVTDSRSLDSWASLTHPGRRPLVCSPRWPSGRSAVRVMSGAEREALPRRGQEQAVAERLVFVRMSPEHKVQIVQTLQRLGHVCAMIGDGANDAAAIRAAMVGIGVAGHGSDPARGAADVMLLDGRIEALVGALDEGRQRWRTRGRPRARSGRAVAHRRHPRGHWPVLPGDRGAPPRWRWSHWWQPNLARPCWIHAVRWWPR
jgi:hypothetical protein